MSGDHINDTFSGDIRLGLRLAWRELRSQWLGARGKGLRSGWASFGVFLACLALGVGSITAVGHLTAAVEEGLRADAKGLLGGDLELRRGYVPVDEGALELLREAGDISKSVRMRAMARAGGQSQESVDASAGTLAEIKAVDDAYPLYGELELSPAISMDQALKERDGVPGAVAEEKLLVRLGLELGDAVQLGETSFQIRAVIEREPDKAANFFGLGPRIIIDRPALEQTGLLTPGSLAYYYVKVRLDSPGPQQLQAVKQRLKDEFPKGGWRVREYNEAGGGLRRSMGNISMYLTLVGLASLLVGGIGVANGVSAYLRDKVTTIAALKCFGGQRRLVISMYLIQILLLSALGSAIGLVLGLGAANVGGWFLATRLDMAVKPGLYPIPLLLGLGYGLLTGLAFSLPPLSRAANIAPARLWRGYADPTGGRLSRKALLATSGVFLALLALTVLTSHERLIALGFAGAVLISVLVLTGCGAGVKRLARAAHVGDPRWRQALANLHRPGAATLAVIFSLGLGLTVLCAVLLIDGNMQTLISQDMPKNAPSYFFLNVPNTRLDAFEEDIRKMEGVTRFESQPSLRGRIVEIDGVPTDEVEIDPEVAWAVRGDRGLTYEAEMPDKVELARGEWWPADYNGPPLICMAEGIAQGFGVSPGDTLTLNVMGREIEARIACTRTIDWTTLQLNHAFTFAPGTIEKAPHSVIATVYAESKAVEDAIMRRVTGNYPDVTAVYVKDVLRDVSELVGRIGVAVRAAAVITLLAGLLVLAETIRAALRGRHYEAVLFKVLGATRRDVLVMLTLELALLGLAAALVAGLLGLGMSWAFVHFALRGEWTFLPGPLALAVAGGAMATLLAGMAGVRSVLGKKAWPVLRNE